MREKPTHTPKPWRVEISKSGNLAILGEETHRQLGFSECCICLIAPAGQITPIDHANGALIAAAPELLEALEAMVKHHTPCEWVDTSGSEYSQLNKARAAIAKAKP